VAKVPATQLSLEYLRGIEFLVDKVEYSVPSKPFPKHHDMFNLFDIVAIGKRPNYAQDHSTYFIQTTSASNLHGRLGKMREHREVVHMCDSGGNLMQVHAWKKDKRGQYQLRVVDVSYDRMTQAVQYVDVTSGWPSIAEVRARVREQKETAPAKRESGRRPKRKS
jgi:hypothetical protein